MKRLIFLALVALLMTSTLVEAQDKPQPSKAKPSVLSFIDPDVVLDDAETWAIELEKCDTRETPWRLTCKKLLEAYNEPEQIQDFDSIQELTAYIRSEIGKRPCPSPQANLEIAGAQGDDYVFINRPCRPNESLFFDIGKNLAFASTVCGQPIRNPIGSFSGTGIGLGGGGKRDSQRERWRDSEERRDRDERQSQSGQNWLGRNWKWAVPVALGTGVLAGTLLGNNKNVNINCNGTTCSGQGRR